MSRFLGTKKKIVFSFALFLTTISIIVLILLLLTNWQLTKYKPHVRFFGDFPVASDPEIGFVARKNSSTYRVRLDQQIEYHLYTDSRGARMNKPGEVTPENVQIVTIGGSFSWGHGIENEETFTQRIREYLHVPVANFAYGSYGTLQSLQLLKRNVDIKPRVIIYGFIKDHIRRNLWPCAPSDYPFCSYVSYIDFNQEGVPFIKKPKSDFKRFISRVQKIQKCNERGFSLIHLTLGLEILIAKAEKNIHISNARKNYRNKLKRIKSLDFLISEMNRVGKRIGATLIVMYIPNFKKVLPPPKELIEVLKDKKEIIFLDLTNAVNAFVQANRQSILQLYGKGGHPSAMAHKLMAAELKKIILLNNLIKNSAFGGTFTSGSFNEKFLALPFFKRVAPPSKKDLERLKQQGVKSIRYEK